MKNLLLFITIMISLLTTSCMKTEDTAKLNDEQTLKSDAPTSLNEYFLFYQQLKEVSHAFLLQSYNGIYTSPINFTLTSRIVGNNTPFNVDVNTNVYDFSSNYSFISSNNHSEGTLTSPALSGIYGKYYNLNLSSNSLILRSDGPKSNPLDSIYLPKLLISVNFDLLIQDSIGNTCVAPNTKVLWNKDDDNDEGVVVAIEYFPTNQYDTIIKQNYPYYIVWGVTIPDYGTYTFKSSDFDSFPNHSLLTFHVLRAGYTIFTDTNNDDYAFAGIVGVSAEYQFEKGN